MIREPLVSIIIPVYNVEPYLAEALDSVIHQTYEKLEIIIVDDGSTDGSGVICDNYAGNDERITVIHQKNKGLSAARNAGLDRMSGDLVAFLDSDDAYEDVFIEKLLNAMRTADADLAVCKYTVHHTKGKLKRYGSRSMPYGASGIYNHRQGLRALADDIINVSVWNKLYRRELWQEIRYPVGHVCEDLDTSFRILDLCNTIYVLDEPLYLYRKRPGSITDTFSMENVQDKKLACSHFSDFLEFHTPDIFTQAQNRKWRQAPITPMIASYIRCTEKKGRTAGKFREELRDQIIATGKDNGIDTLRIRARVAWHMMCKCPWLLSILYPVYRHVRLLVFRIVGR